MKKAFLFLITLLATTAFAADPVCTKTRVEEVVKETLRIETDVPNFLKGATIIVRLADGTESAVPAEKFKVVPRKQQFIVTTIEKSESERCTVGGAKKNRVSLMGGSGAQGGLESRNSPTAAEVESKTGFVGGAQYQRMLNETISIGVQGQTNETGSILIGVDF